MTHEHETEAIIPPRQTGVNGIPDLPVQADAVKQPIDTSADRSESIDATSTPAWVGWIAVGAVVVGTIGVIAGLSRRTTRRRPRATLHAIPDPHALTPPHGDKLMRPTAVDRAPAPST